MIRGDPRPHLLLQQVVLELNQRCHGVAISFPCGVQRPKVSAICTIESTQMLVGSLYVAAARPVQHSPEDLHAAD